MDKKKANEKARKQNSEKLTSKTATEKDKISVPEDPFDFGGLPQRDLKKNLGCG